MKAVVTGIHLENLDKHEAMELLAELNKLDVVFSTEYPRLNEFRKILNGCFTSMVPDVHYISKRD